MIVVMNIPHIWFGLSGEGFGLGVLVTLSLSSLLTVSPSSHMCLYTRLRLTTCPWTWRMVANILLYPQ